MEKCKVNMHEFIGSNFDSDCSYSMNILMNKIISHALSEKPLCVDSKCKARSYSSGKGLTDLHYLHELTSRSRLSFEKHC